MCVNELLSDVMFVKLLEKVKKLIESDGTALFENNLHICSVVICVLFLVH